MLVSTPDGCITDQSIYIYIYIWEILEIKMLALVRYSCNIVSWKFGKILIKFTLYKLSFHWLLSLPVQLLKKLGIVNPMHHST